eukprot:1610350-Prymnesium_polylepis.1
MAWPLGGRLFRRRVFCAGEAFAIGLAAGIDGLPVEAVEGRREGLLDSAAHQPARLCERQLARRHDDQPAARQL